jgi:hypothetical protein
MKSVKTQLKNFQYFYPYTVALVGAQAGKRVNFMSCAWHTALPSSASSFPRSA